MDLLEWFDSTKLLISGKFKYFHYNTSSGSLELLPGHFLKGVDFEYSTRKDNVCILKINDLELNYDESNGKITTRNEVIGSNVTLEPYNDFLSYLKYSDKYFDEELKLVEKEKAVKVQALENYQAEKLKLPSVFPSSINEDNEGSNNLLSIEGLPIIPNSQEFQIVLEGGCFDYADDFEGELFFTNESYISGDKFQLVKVNSKLTLYNPLKGYLGRGTDKDECKSVMYYKEIPDNLVYLEKYQDNGMYLMRCGGGESNEDDYFCVFWVNSICGFSDFTTKKEEASVMQFTMCYELNSEKVSYTAIPNSKL